jgi:putative ABC transport system ATP-binding protein
MTAAVVTDMLAVTDVVRTFGSGRTATRALRGVSLGVPAGQLVALRGRSGRVGGRDVTAMSSRERMELRRTSVAFIFQPFGLIPILSAAENVGGAAADRRDGAEGTRGAGPAHAGHRRPRPAR